MGASRTPDPMASRKNPDVDSPDRAPTAATTWDPENGIFLPAERRRKGIGKTALCVQITLCIVVAALLFSVIALPKLRYSAGRIGNVPASQAAAGRR
jgi:hypothetical protein